MRHALSAATLMTALLGCNTEPDSGWPSMNHLDLAPAVMFLAPGETKPVIARLFSPEGTQVHADLAVSASPGLTARIDSTFRQVYAADGSLMQFPDLTEQRLLVTMESAVETGVVRVIAGDIVQELAVRPRP